MNITISKKTIGFKALVMGIILSLMSTMVVPMTVSAATPSSVSLAAQKKAYGNIWYDQQTPGWPAYQCQGFAVRMKYETGKKAVSTWQKIYKTNNLNDVKAGDIIRYTIKAGNTTSLHSIFIINVSSNGTIKYADANNDLKNGIRWEVTMTSAIKNRIIQSINNEGTNANPTYIWR